MKRVWRWVKRVTIGLLAVLVAALAFALIAVHTDWGRDIVRGQVEKILASSFPGGATIGRIDGSPFGTLVIRDITLNGPDRKPLVAVKRATVEASLLPLFGHQVWVDRVVAEGVTITNPRAPAPPDDEPKTPSPWTIDLPHVEVHDVALHLDAQPGGEATDVTNLSLYAALHVAPISGELSALAWLDGRWKQRSARVAGMVSAVVGDDVTVPVLSLDVAGATLVGALAVTRRGELAPSGTLAVSAPVASVAQLAPAVAIPADAWLIVRAATLGSISTADLLGAMGGSRLHGRLMGAIVAERASGVLAVTDVDLALVSKGAATGRADVLVGATVGPDGLRGSAITRTGQLVAPAVHRTRKPAGAPVDEAPLSVPAVHAVVAFAAQPTQASALVLASAAGRARVAMVGAVHAPSTDRIVVDSARVGATVPEVMLASGGLAPVRGAVDLEAEAHGEIGKDLAVRGWFAGRRLRMDALAIADVRGEASAVIGAAISGRATATARGIANAGTPVGAATIEARTRSDGRIAVVVDATPAAAPIAANVAAVVSLPTPEGVIAIDLESHRIQLPNGTWAGTGGSVRIDQQQIAVRDLRSHSGDARLLASVNAGRGTGVITGTVKLTDASLGRMSKDFRGTIDANLAIEKRGIRWKGGGTIAAKGVALAPDALPIDGNVELAVDGRRVKVGVRASSPSIGGGRVAIEVDGPRDLTDAAAWKKVARADLHAITVGLDSLQGSALSGGSVSGIFDGTIEIREGIPDGKLRVRGIPTPLGTAGADLTVALDDVGFLDVQGQGSIGNAGDVTLGARVQIPDRPFDAEVYKRIGKNLVQSAFVQTSDIEVNPDILAKLGVRSPFSGIVVAKLDVGTGGSSIGVGLDVKGLTGGPLRAPLDVHVGAGVDATATTASLRVSARQGTLLELSDASIPVSLDRWIALAATKPFALPDVPVSGTLAIPTLDAKQTLALVGRRDVLGGTLAGKVVVGGTLRAPTATGTIDLANVAVRPRLTGKPPPTLTALHVGASWASDRAELRITGEEPLVPSTPRPGQKPRPAVKPTLLVEASTDPAKLGELVGTIAIRNFDLAPVAVFLPGVLVGAQGILDADLKVAGIGATGKGRGFVELNELRLPFSPLFSPLRSGKLRVDFADTGAMSLALDGIVGAQKSTVKVTANADPTATDTTLKVQLVELTPIGYLQPKITANVRGTVHRKGLFWSGELEVTQGLVFIPETRGNDLLEDYTPSDLIFVGEEEVDVESTRLRPPAKPFLVLDMNIRTTRIELPSFVIPTLVNVPIIERAKATAAGRVRVSVGDTIGMDGEILVDRGEAEVLGRKYDVDLGQIGFDGTIDPLFDLKLSHEFETEGVTTSVRFAGRLSEIDTLEPEFTSDPGSYSQSQLFGFFLGGTPGADTGQEGQDALSAAGQAAVSNIAQAFARRLSGNKIDVLRCDPETSTTGRSCMLGKYFGKREQLFLGALRRLAPTFDENQTELRLEYRFRNGIRFELSGGDRAIFGADLLHKQRF